jgi:ABC-type nitrate/sulfonate/bicarbonate transport system permease component
MSSASAVGTPSVGTRIRALANSWPPVVSVVCVMALFELLSRADVIPRSAFPPLTVTFETLGDLLGAASFWTAVWDTLMGWGIGLGIAAGTAIPLGVLIGTSHLLYRSLRVPIEFLRPIPSVALIPLAILVYGTGIHSKVFLVVFAAFWQLLINTLYGVRDVDPVTIDTARAFGLGPVERLGRITLPSAVPYIATGLRIASTTALILAVTAELVIGSPGLGREIELARQGGANEIVYALIIVLGILGWVLNAGFSRLERRALHWHPSQWSKGGPA